MEQLPPTWLLMKMLKVSPAHHLCCSDWLCTLELLSSCRQIGEEGLKLLGVLKQKQPGSGNIAASTNSVQKSIRSLTRLVEVCINKNIAVVIVTNTGTSTKEGA